MSTFGDLERAFASLYEYRWAIGAGVLVFVAAFLAFGYWKRWHLFLWRRRLPVGLISAPVLALTLWLGWSLGAPLFTNVTVEEEFPYAFTATVPAGMEREDIERAMSGIAEFDDPAMEAMPSPSAMALESAVSRAMSMMGEAQENKAPDLMDKGMEMMQEAVDNASRATDDQAQAVLIRTGEFKDADSFHRGSGQAIVYRGTDGSDLLRLENLDVTNGPALHVYLSAHEDPENPGEVRDQGYHDLGRLKGNRGNQNYPIPSDVDVTDYNSVVIYCKPFHVVFSVASLVDAS